MTENEKRPERHSINSRPTHISKTPLIYVLAAAIIIGLSFIGGVQYEKGHIANQPVMRGFGAGSQGFSDSFSARGRVYGTVSAISSSSISVNDRISNSAITANINSSTQILDNSQTVSTSDIKSGDTVLMRVDTSSPPSALRINVNPTTGAFNQNTLPPSTTNSD